MRAMPSRRDPPPADLAGGPPAPRSGRHVTAWPVPLVAAALLLLAILGYREIGFRAERARLASAVTAAQRALAARDAELAELREELHQREESLETLEAALVIAGRTLDVIQQHGLTFAVLRGGEGASPAEGHVLVGPPGGRAWLYAIGLPGIAADRVYALWWITEARGRVRAAVFHPDAYGVGRAEAPVPGDAGAIKAVAVTVEASAAAAEPAGPVVLRGRPQPRPGSGSPG